MSKRDNASNSEYALEIQGPSFRQIIFLNRKDYSIGRHPSNSIILPFEDISDRHATLVRITDEATNSYFYGIFDGNLEGIRSKYGTFVNQKRCIARELKHGDIIEFASFVTARYYFASQVSMAFDLAQLQQNPSLLDEERYRTVIVQAREGIVLVNAVSKRILEANEAYCRLLRYTGAEIIGLSLYDVVASDRTIVDEKLARSSTQEEFIDEFPHRRKDSALLTVEASVSPVSYGKQEAFLLVVRDITERKQLEEKLQYQASHDYLTGLPNRTLFHEQLSIAIANAKRYQYSIAVMFLDLDGFKVINDNLGHAFGDRILQRFADRVKSCLRAGDLLTRWGGDEFSILVAQVRGAEEVTNISQRILGILKQPFDLGVHNVRLKCSIGIALYPEAGEEADTLIERADEAAYYIKGEGGNNYGFYRSTQQL